MLEHLLTVVASFLAAVILTPIVRMLAVRLGIVDRPDPRRKLHGRVVARAGGTAVLLSVLSVCLVAYLRFDRSELPLSSYQSYVALLVVMVGVWLLGLADDIWNLRGRQKLVGQIVLVGILVTVGQFQIQHVGLFSGVGLELGLLTLPVSAAWLLATTNAMNLIDGADGLCSTLGAIICGALGLLAAAHGHAAEAAIAFALCGALLGFLVFNFPPASIFLGDSGSLLVGMVTGALAIRCSIKEGASIAFLVPLAILFLPLLDSAMAIVRRKLTGRSIYTTDRAHFHHTLKSKGLSDRGLLFVVMLISLTTAAGALAGDQSENEWIAPASVVVVFGVLVATKAFGYAELVLVARRGSHFALSLLEPARKAEKPTRQKAVRLQGTRQWETVWATLVEFAENEELCTLHMDLNVPWLEEGFHGSWHRSRLPDRLERWSASLPIHAEERIAGRIDIVGPASTSATLGTLAKLVELLEDLSPQVESLLSPVESEALDAGAVIPPVRHLPADTATVSTRAPAYSSVTRLN